MIKRVSNGNTHIGDPQLGDYRTVNEFHQGMHNALRMDHHIDLISTHPKEPSCFDHLKPFVHHCCRIYGNLSPHPPVWMLEGIVDRDLAKLLLR